MSVVGSRAEEFRPWFPWNGVEVAEDDRTVTVHYRAEFSPDELRPTLAVEYEADRVLVGLTFEPLANDLGFAFASDSAPQHRSSVSLSEPVRGRSIVDLWQPPPAPAVAERIVALHADFAPIAGDRRLTLERLEVHGDFMRVEYTLRPGARDAEEDTHLMWDLTVEDDLDTDYDVPSGAYGSGLEEIRGDRDVYPAPPLSAQRLTLLVFDVVADGEYHEIGRVHADLGPGGTT